MKKGNPNPAVSNGDPKKKDKKHDNQKGKPTNQPREKSFVCDD
jgi:hypothetical protein